MIKYDFKYVIPCFLQEKIGRDTPVYSFRDYFWQNR